MSMHLDYCNRKEPTVFATGGDSIPDGFGGGVPLAMLIKKIDGDLLKLHAEFSQLHATVLEGISKTSLSRSTIGGMTDEIDAKRCSVTDAGSAYMDKEQVGLNLPSPPYSDLKNKQDRSERISDIRRMDSQPKPLTREEREREYERVCNEHQAEVAEDDSISEQNGLSRRIAKVILGSNFFEPLFALCIAANTITNGIETHHAAVSLSSTPPALCYMAQSIFNGLFLFELVVRVTASGWVFFWDAEAWYWNWFDIFCCSGIIFEILVGLISTTEVIGDVSKYRVVKVAKLTRLVRVVRVSRLLRFLKALHHLVLCIMSTLRSLAWALILLIILLFCFSTILLEGATEYRMRDRADTDPVLVAEFEKWWGGMPNSFNTLFMCITGGVSWIEPALPLDALYILYPFTFLCFIAFSILTFLNVVTGCFCESAIANAQRDEEVMLCKEEEKLREYIDRLRAVFCRMDMDGSATITLDEFTQKLEEKTMQLIFKTLDIDVHDAKDFFRLLDSDASGRVDVEELLLGCMRMKGGARGIDMFRVIHDISHLIANVEHLSHAIEESLQLQISSTGENGKERMREIIRGAIGMTSSRRNKGRRRTGDSVSSAIAGTRKS